MWGLSHGDRVDTGSTALSERVLLPSSQAAVPCDAAFAGPVLWLSTICGEFGEGCLRHTMLLMSLTDTLMLFSQAVAPWSFYRDLAKRRSGNSWLPAGGVGGWSRHCKTKRGRRGNGEREAPCMDENPLAQDAVCHSPSRQSWGPSDHRTTRSLMTLVWETWLVAIVTVTFSEKSSRLCCASRWTCSAG